MARCPARFRRFLFPDAFTLVELLIVVAILLILAAIALPNLREAKRRAETVACAANLKAIGAALLSYRIDWDHLPLADGASGRGDSRSKTKFGFGPAANGWWSAVPNALVEARYVADRKTLSCPTLWRQRVGRREHLRYAYNAGATDVGGFQGGTGGTPIDGPGATGGKQWLARCLFLNSQAWAPESYVAFPHGPDPDPRADVWGDENVLWNDLSVTRVAGNAP